MTPDDDATTVRVPIALRRIFDELKNRNNWLNFADFSREAIREKLTRENLLALREIEEREEPGPLRSSQGKPSS